LRIVRSVSYFKEPGLLNTIPVIEAVDERLRHGDLDIVVVPVTTGRTAELFSQRLKEEGQVRELIRRVQVLRKKAGLKPKDKILVQFSGTEDLNRVLIENKDFILKQVKAEQIKIGKEPPFTAEKEAKIKGERLWLAIKKIE